MPFGILDPRTDVDHHVPGTVQLRDEQTLEHHTGSHLKKGTGRNSHIILVPQPSNDPNDPLNWPLWQRDGIFFLLCYCTILSVGGVGPLLSSSAFVLVQVFGIDFSQVSLLTGYQLCAVGACGIFISALAQKYGKRPTVVFSVTCVFGGTLWGGAANSYASLVGARVLQGVGVAMFESVMYATVGDLYFVHERGTRMAFLTTSISGLANLPAMIAGVTTQNLGWRWMFWLLAIFLGIAWVAVIFFGWETAFIREAISDTNTASADNLEAIKEMKESDPADQIENAETPPAPSAVGKRKSLARRMALYNGTFSDDNVLKMLLKPFAILIHPAVIWSTLVIATTTTWLVVISFVVAQIFSAPPYLLDTAAIGYLSAGPVVGGTLGCIICGMVSDPITKFLSKKNQGIYEPEFRLVLVIGVFVTSLLGYFLFGNLITEGKSPVVISTVWGIAVASMQFCSVAVGTYMVDAYRDISVEIFIIGMVFKNFMFFGFSFFMNNWVDRWGPARVFNCIGGIQAALCLTTIPMWIYGKRLREYYSRHRI